MLPISDIKIDLTTRLKAVRLTLQVNTATNAVVKAETNKLTSDVNTANLLVSYLPTGDVKTGLLNRIAIARVTIATLAVEKAELSVTQSDINSASSLINALPTGDVKTALTNRLNTVKLALPLVNATKAVVSAESFKTQTSINSALTLVNGLPASDIKTTLISRIQAVQQLVNVASATKSVETAETYKISTYINTAKILITKLIDGTDKTTLTNRVNAIVPIK